MTPPGGWELVVLLAVALVLFGSNKLPGAARSIGQSMRIFKAEIRNQDTNPPPEDVVRAGE
ncbi:MAG: twin-arginine translocase TatA/TatE family subunit [Pseudonocardiaceae bacterium]|nr:twin-arginine translocase TatA/TatE family subunit [Pseudonocardiaceae bacterium]